MAISVPAGFASMQKLGDQVAAFPLTAGNAVRLLDGGDEAYPQMLAAIRAAERHVALSSYIFDNDPVGGEFADALVAAQARGVAVRVLIDAVGARYSRPPIVGRLREGGVTTALFMGEPRRPRGCPTPICAATGRCWWSTAPWPSPAA